MKSEAAASEGYFAVDSVLTIVLQYHCFLKGIFMDEMENVRNIRREILAMDKPFCLTDLYSRLERKGITDRGLILRILDELYDEGLIEYDKIEGIVDEADSWAFRIA